MTQLTEVIRAEPRDELRLTDEAYLKYGVTPTANIRQKSQMLEDEIRQKMGFIDDHDGLVTLGRVRRQIDLEPSSLLSLGFSSTSK